MTPDTTMNTMGEILETIKNVFRVVQSDFFMIEDLFGHLDKVLSDFKTLCKVIKTHPIPQEP